MSDFTHEPEQRPPAAFRSAQSVQQYVRLYDGAIGESTGSLCFAALMKRRNRRFDPDALET